MTHRDDGNDRKESEAVLRRRIADLESELQLLYYSVSHDFRAPLRAIEGFSAAVLEDYAAKLDEDGRRYLRRMRGAAQRMSSMIDGLLELSRANQRSLQLGTVDLATLARRIVEELREREPGRRVSGESPEHSPHGETRRC